LVEPGIRACVTARYAVCYGASGLEPSQILSALPAKARELLSAGLLFSQVEPDPGNSHAEACSELTTAEARALAEALEDEGYEHAEPTVGQGATLGDFTLAYFVEIPGTAQGVGVGFEPMLPHGEWICPACG
jgi:hypothetical protein